MLPILPLIQAGMGVINAKKQANAARKENAARAALGEPPSAQPGEGVGGALMKGLGGVASAMSQQKPEAEPDGDEGPVDPPPRSAPPKLPAPPPMAPDPMIGSLPAGQATGDPNSFVPGGTQKALGTVAALGPTALGEDLTQGLGLGALMG